MKSSLTKTTMPTYEEVLNLAKNLSPDEKSRLIEALKTLDYTATEVEESDEIISDREIEQSENAWQEYLAGIDTGVTSAEIKKKLFGDKFD
jgi:hypothetical protein